VSHSSRAAWLAAAVVAALVALVPAPSAFAKRQSIPASARHDNILIFKLEGIAPFSVRSARLQTGRHARPLRVRTVRAAARRGTLRTRFPKRWRASRSTRAKGRPPTLVVTIDSSVPSAPSGLAATPGDGSATLTWDKSSDNVGVSGYEVFRANADGSSPSAAITTTAGTSYTDSGLMNGTAYTYRVVAYDAAGNRSVESSSATVTPSAPPPSPPVTVPEGAKFVSPSGSDSNSGTESAPWRTIAKALSAARPGDTVVLRAGTYGARGTTTTANESGTAAAPISFRAYPGETPVILGHFKVEGDYLRFTGFLFAGPTGQVKDVSTDNPKGEQVEVTVNGDHVEISHSEVRDSDWHAGIFLSGAEDVRIVANYIHDNGDDGSCCYKFQENASHGIYFSSGSGLIANNVIEQNLARGVQLYTGPHDVMVSENTIVHNGRAGVQVANDTADSTVANNIVAYNGDTGIRSASLVGAGNLVVGNLLWGNANPGLNQGGLTVRHNITADPRFAGSTDYHLQSGSPAIDGALASYAVGQDFDGLLRPQGPAPDIGAFEAH
jgi:chitodextrinase